MPTELSAVAIEYPSSDGEPMAETQIHADAMIFLHQALQDFFAGRPDVFWYWEEENNNARTAPDVIVVPGVEPRDRRSFFSWEEDGPIPAVVFEMASEGTYRDDEGKTLLLYEQIGVPEYFLFDPEVAYLRTQLKGYRLNGGTYRRIRRTSGELESLLGFRPRAEGQMIRVYDANGTPLPTLLERADAQQQRADQLPAEIERPKTLLQKRGECPS